MTAKVLSFPLTRRPHDVQLLASNMAGMAHEKAERYLRDRLKRTADVLTGNQLSPEQVAEQVKQFEGAIRVALWRRIILRGGAA
jgi:hypothetical protein